MWREIAYVSQHSCRSEGNFVDEVYSLFPPLHRFQGLNLGHWACQTSTFTRSTVFSDHLFDTVTIDLMEMIMSIIRVNFNPFLKLAIVAYAFNLEFKASLCYKLAVLLPLALWGYRDAPPFLTYGSYLFILPPSIMCVYNKLCEKKYKRMRLRT